MVTFTPTPDQRAAALDDVVYEMEQLAGACQHFVDNGTGPESATPDTEYLVLTANIYLEALLLHVRVLLDFFEHSRRTIRKRVELDDILSQDFGFRAERIDISTLELTRFGGHLISAEKGVYDAESASAVPAGVSAADGGAGPIGPHAGGVSA